MLFPCCKTQYPATTGPHWAPAGCPWPRDGPSPCHQGAAGWGSRQRGKGRFSRPAHTARHRTTGIPSPPSGAPTKGRKASGCTVGAPEGANRQRGKTRFSRQAHTARHRGFHRSYKGRKGFGGLVGAVEAATGNAARTGFRGQPTPRAIAPRAFPSVTASTAPTRVRQGYGMATRFGPIQLIAPQPPGPCHPAASNPGRLQRPTLSARRRQPLALRSTRRSWQSHA